MAEHIAALSGAAPENLAIVFTVASCVVPVTMIFGGIINDRFGPRSLVLIGGLLFGGGMIASSFATSKAMLIVTYGVCCGLADGCIYGATLANAVKLFPDRSGLAGGVITAGYGISSVIVPFVANWLITQFGITAAFRALGIVMFVIIFISAFFISGKADSAAADTRQPSDIPSDSEHEKNWRQMLADPLFYTMFLMLVCGAFSGLMIISQASPIAQSMENVSAAEAAGVVSILALANTLGRITCGTASDKLGALRTLRIVYVCFVIGALLLFSSTGHLARFYVGICIVGFCFGAFMGVFPGLTAAQFGTKNNSVNYGVMFIAFATAGIVGPSVASAILRMTGTYTPSFLVAAALAVCGLALTVLFKRQSRRR